MAGTSKSGLLEPLRFALESTAGPWRSLEDVEFATLEWGGWFNHRRLLKPIGHIPPAEAEANFYLQLEEPNLAA